MCPQLRVLPAGPADLQQWGGGSGHQPSAIRPCPGNQSINNICQNKSVFGTVVSAMVKTPARLSDFYPKLPVLIGMLLLNIVQYRYLVVRFTLYSGANILKF